ELFLFSFLFFSSFFFLSFSYCILVLDPTLHLGVEPA
ncbi:hypothetical protein LINPERPRIM_LOCUS29992, partial [Linum perenne]